MSTTLSATEWLDHGLRALEREGLPALKADRLAKELGVSRGSFYWHFADLAEFKNDLARRWQTVTFADVVDELDGAEISPSERLVGLIQRGAESNGPLERAMRSWAFSDPVAAEVVSETDALRVAYLASLFVGAGLDEPSAASRAAAFYFAAVGSLTVGSAVTDAHREGALAQLLVLIP